MNSLDGMLAEQDAAWRDDMSRSLCDATEGALRRVRICLEQRLEQRIDGNHKVVALVAVVKDEDDELIRATAFDMPVGDWEDLKYEIEKLLSRVS